MGESNQVVISRDVIAWKDRIETAWQRSVESVVEVGRLINEARSQLGATYALLETELPFSTTVASFLSKIAKHPVLSDPHNFSRLPNGVNTLYHLTFLDEKTLIQQLQHGDISPNTTLNEVRTLRIGNSTDTKPSEKQPPKAAVTRFEVGSIYIPVPNSLDKFTEELTELLTKYDGQIVLSKSKGSLAESHRQALLAMAIQQINIAEDDLSQLDLETSRIFDDAIHFLSKDKQGKYRKTVMEDGKAEEHSCLPDDYRDLKLLRKMLERQDIHRSSLLSYCKNNKILLRYVDLKNLDKEFYIWEQIRLYTTRKDSKGAIKRLKDLASYSPHANIKELAKKMLAELTRFD